MEIAAKLTASGPLVGVGALSVAAKNEQDEGTRITFGNLPDRIWIGAEFWANPMEDWRIKDGKLECISTQGNRNIHLLTHQLSDRAEPFAMSVRTGIIEKGERGGTGFRIGIHDSINDYRGSCVWGEGVDVGIANGTLIVGERNKPFEAESDLSDVRLDVEATPVDDETFDVTLHAYDVAAGRSIGKLTGRIAAEQLKGNVALVNNFSAQTKEGSSFWFDDWRLAGETFDIGDDHVFGPILWTMHTVSNTRTADGYEFKMSVQMPPLGEADGDRVRLDAQRNGEWEFVGESTIDPAACLASFSAKNWDVSRDTLYRVSWTQLYRNGHETLHTYEGVIRKEPTDRPLVMAGMTCQQHMGFPYGPVAEGIAKQDPDLLFFSGDQIYEENGHYGITRRPANAAILSYLRKWFMFGWVFGDLMRDRPTLCIPDDHDVFQGNIWGEGGAKMQANNANSRGGYIQPVEMLRVVHLTNTGHHPRLFDPTPVKQGITVYYGDMVWGRVSFAIVGDRQFKTGPEKTGGDGRPRTDWIPPGFTDIASLDDPSFVMLGERQEQFLEHWVSDWRGHDMKVLLSETTWTGVATHHGYDRRHLQGDLDSGAWPMTARNRAVSIARKGFPVHINGDQHLPTLVKYGIDEFEDSCWSFCTPAISAGYPRWWSPDEVGKKLFGGRPDHGMPHTGHYLDGMNHPVHVQAIANPTGLQHDDRYTRSQMKASGFGIVRVDPKERTYTFECYKFDATRSEEPEQLQYAGWPHTVDQIDNDGRARFGTLPMVNAPDGVENPVVIVERDGDVIYSIRARGASFKPFVFEDGTYTVRIGDPDADVWETHPPRRPLAGIDSVDAT